MAVRTIRFDDQGRWMREDEPSEKAAASADDDRLQKAEEGEAGSLKQAAVKAIKTVYDPEIPVNIWELGLIYDVTVKEVDAAEAAAGSPTIAPAPEGMAAPSSMFPGAAPAVSPPPAAAQPAPSAPSAEAMAAGSPAVDDGEADRADEDPAEAAPEGTRQKAFVKMTLTSPGCFAAQVLPGEVQKKIESVDGIDVCQVDVVWDPPWNQTMMSEAARLALNIMW